MRQETILKTYLKFNELSPSQQTKVLDKNRDINVDDQWYEFTYEAYTNKLSKLGFYDIKLSFSGFYSQGDGASFSAKHSRGNIYTRGRYCHSNTMNCDESDTLLVVSKRIADSLYKDLRNEYEYLTSDAAVKDTLEVNDYEFDSETLKIA